MVDDVDMIEAAPRTVKFRGADVAVRPLKVGAIPAVTRALRGLDMAGDIDVLDLVAEHGDKVAEAVAAATGIPVAEINDADLDEFAELVAVVVEVNTDFFVRRVAPRIQGITERLGAGLIRSSS